jgi:hypothetical protein
MEWHWGNIGSAIAGASALAIAIGALIRSPAALRDWRERQRAQAEAAREQAETARLERRRGLSGWSNAGVETYGVTLVTEADELGQAVTELTSGQPTAYVILRVSESSYDNSNRGNSLRQLIQHEGLISRPPTVGEREAVERGLDAIGVPQAAFGRTRPRKDSLRFPILAVADPPHLAEPVLPARSPAIRPPHQRIRVLEVLHVHLIALEADPGVQRRQDLIHRTL